MKKLTLIFLLFLTTSAFSQINELQPKADGQLEAGKPTTYLEYGCQDKKNVQLRMFNNTIWAVAVNSDKLYYKTEKTVKLANGKEFYAMPNDREVSLQYRIEKFALPSENVKIPKVNYPDSSSTNWIASGDYVLFSVPIEYLRKDLQIFVKFNYEWELTKRGSIVSGPEHRISFRGIDLPVENPIACDKSLFGNSEKVGRNS